MPADANRFLYNTLRNTRGPARFFLVQVIHNFQPGRGGALHARNIPHGFTAEISRPHADRVALTKTNAPVVTHIFTGSGLHRRPKSGGQWTFPAKGFTTTAAVRENMINQEGR